VQRVANKRINTNKYKTQLQQS